MFAMNYFVIPSWLGVQSENGEHAARFAKTSSLVWKQYLRCCSLMKSPHEPEKARRLARVTQDLQRARVSLARFETSIV